MKLQKYKYFFNKVAVFINSNSANYWNTITVCNIKSKPVKLGDYYLDFSSKSEYNGKLDENEIPLYRLGSGDYFYHPIVICQYALGLFQKLLDRQNNSEIYKKRFLRQADWLIENIEEKDGMLGWLVKYDIDDFDVQAPWFSSMAQGEAISVLMRAHLITGKEDYIQLARKALDIFEHSIAEGGIVSTFQNYPVYEECPSPTKPMAVLNGFIFSLYGLYDLLIGIGDERANKLFEKGIDSLSNILYLYDLKYWSQYYLYDYPKSYPASFTYHMLVVEQLKTLHILTGRDIFLEYSNRWKNQSENIICKLRALLAKLLFAHKFNWTDVNKSKSRN